MSKSLNQSNSISMVGFCPVSESSNTVENFYRGLYYIHNNKFSDAIKYLTLAVNNTEPMDAAYYEYLSYLGVTEVLFSESRGGLIHCYDAIKSFSVIPDIYINLACAELALGDRRRSIIAIEQCLKKFPKFSYKQHLNQCIRKRDIIDIKQKKNRFSIFKKILRKKNNQCLSATTKDVFSDILSNKLNNYISRKN